MKKLEVVESETLNCSDTMWTVSTSRPRSVRAMFEIEHEAKEYAKNMAEVGHTDVYIAKVRL